MSGSSSVSDGNGDGIGEVGEDDFPADFKEYMQKDGLSCSRSKPEYQWSLSYGWVFWSQHHHQIEPSLSLDNHVDFIPDVCVSSQVRDKIRCALEEMMWYENLEASLVQFWAPTKTSEGRTLLTTQTQPFALGKTYHMFEKQRLCEYRMRMMGREYHFYADEESGEEQLGLPGRVFRHKSPESAPDVKCYSLKEYPQLDLAVSCNIKRSWALPVIEHSSQTCVGVLEIVSLYSMDSVWHDRSFLDRMYGIFQDRGVTLQLGPLDQRSIDGINNGMNGCSEAQNSVLPIPEPLQNGKDQGVTLQLGPLDQRSIDGINNGMNGCSEAQNSVLPIPEPLQNGKVTTQVDSSDQPPMDPSNNGQNVVTAEGNIIVVSSSKEGTRKRQAREDKQTGVRIEISLEDILKHSEKRRKIAARELKVSISTLRRVCRRYGITRWPPRDRENVYPVRPSPVENQGQTPQLPVENQGQKPQLSTHLHSNQASASVAHKKLAFQDADMMTIRAKYEDDMIKFRLSLSSTLVDLQQEVAKRLNLEAGTYCVKYKDEENELISITCDEDLQDCIWTSKRLGKPSIAVQLKPKQPINPLLTISNTAAFF